ncbi:MAG: glycosyltransferase [Thermodesulfobacteriota bacterium]
MSPPKVSIIIPSYNHAPYIGEAINSARSQTFDDLEIIIIDDGSKDESFDIIQALAKKDKRIRALAQLNAGSHATINRGIEMSSGKYIAILNSDDRFHPSRIETMLAECELRNLDFLTSGLTLIDADGNEVTHEKHWWLRMYRDMQKKFREDGPLKSLFFGNYTVSTSNFFLRRELYNNLGPLRSMKYVLDWDYAFRAIIKNPEKYDCLIDNPLLDYRLHGSNTITSGIIRSAVEANRMLVHHGSTIYPEAGHILKQIQRNARYQRHQIIQRINHTHDLLIESLRNEFQLVRNNLENTIAETENKLSISNREKENLTQDLIESRSIMQDLSSQNQDLRNFIQDITNSRSFRLGRHITAPFRWAKKHLLNNKE